MLYIRNMEKIIKTIQGLVYDYFGVDYEQIVSNTNKRNVVNARVAYVYALYNIKLNGGGYLMNGVDIGKHINRGSRTIYACIARYRRLSNTKIVQPTLKEFESKVKQEVLSWLSTKPF